MNTASREALKRQLIVDEALKLKPYTDTVGKLTIGIGRNLTDKGISRSEALMLCDNDIDEAIRELDMHLPWWRTMNEVRQQVIVNMCFNLGIGKLKGFRNTLQSMMNKDYEAAAKGMKASLWARQVGARADRLIQMMRTGKELSTKKEAT